MAQGKTKGAVSLYTISFPDLLSRLGDEYKGNVVIGAKWYDGLTKPQTEFVVVSAESLSGSAQVIDLEVTRATPLIPPPPQPRRTRITEADI